MTTSSSSSSSSQDDTTQTLILSWFQKLLSSSVELQPSYSREILLERHRVEAFAWLSNQTGGKDRDRNMLAQSVRYTPAQCSGGPDQFCSGLLHCSRPNSSVFWIRWESVQTGTIFSSVAATPWWHLHKNIHQKPNIKRFIAPWSNVTWWMCINIICRPIIMYMYMYMYIMYNATLLEKNTQHFAAVKREHGRQ